MSTGIWRILGIEQTNDVSVIKRAYAARAKECHPEEQPEKFQQLQNAYKEAIQYAKRRKGDAIVTEEQKDVSQTAFIVQKEPENKEEPEYKEEYEYKYQEPPIIKIEKFCYDEVNYEDAEEQFWIHLQYILWHPFVRKEYDYWQYLLNRSDVQELMQTKEFRNRFLDKLQEENFIWEKSVLNVLDHYLVSFEESANETGVKLASSKLKPGFIQDYLGRTKNKYDTKEEQEIYQVIWWNRDYKEREKPESYLQEFFSYAEENRNRLQEVHRKAHKVRSERPTKRIVKFVAGVILVILCLYARKMEEQQSDMSYQIEQMRKEMEIVDTQFEVMQQAREEKMEKLLQTVEEVAPSLKEYPKVLEVILLMDIDDQEMLERLLIEYENKLSESEK